MYLTEILQVLREQSTHARTKALKCITMIVTEDPDVLLRPDMAAAVQVTPTSKKISPSEMSNVIEDAIDIDFWGGKVNVDVSRDSE